MSKPDRSISPHPDADDELLDIPLRPRSFEEFVGQETIKKNLKTYVAAAAKRGEVLDHVLLSGPPGLGKTTLAYIISNAIGASITVTSGPALEKPKDLAGILTRLKRKDVFFIDEIHRLSAPVEEHLYSAMEDFSIDIVIDQGPHARSIRLDIQPFTLIGSTTREGLLGAPFRSRFGVLEKLDYYPWEDLARIVSRSARILSCAIEPEALEMIARRSRGTPRVANRLLKRVRDFAEVACLSTINTDICHRTFEQLGVDHLGLDRTDRRLLEAIIAAGGAPVGLKTLCVRVDESEDTIEEVYEPYLIRQGFVEKTPRGRLATRQAYEHLSLRPPAGADQTGLFK
ncbi:MAG: Holliday junction branch migration DNA helicase RuvB [Planctomycetota bacterium]